ncbi:MAG: hypothetical protein LBG66_05805 [Gallionellaceae bacterium]|jgi:hypothetical protein|nr:hypothetical protein [Gallionellaceae bacterium]
MLIGYRYEERDGVLRIHAVNWVLRLAPWLPVALYGATLVSLLLWCATGVLEILYFLALAMPVFVLRVRAPIIHETLELDLSHKQGLRRCSNSSGVVQKDTFPLKECQQLQLCRQIGETDSPGPVELWLLMHNGSKYQINFSTVPVHPGKAKTDAWLRRIANYLHLDAPDEIIEIPPQQAQKSAARRRVFVTQATSVWVVADLELIGIGRDYGFVKAALLGSGFAFGGYEMAKELQSALSTGVLQTIGWKTIRGEVLFWNDSPFSFIVNWVVNGGVGLLFGLAALDSYSGCLLIATDRLTKMVKKQYGCE